MTNAECKKLAHIVHGALSAFDGEATAAPDVPEPWASGIFQGARCVLRVMLRGPGAGEAADRFLRDMTEREWTVPGHIVADLGLLDEVRKDGGEEVVLRLEALLIEAE